MTLNSTYNCTSVKKYAGFFTSDQLNITEVVTACPEHCILAWGTGNPDLSGVGVFTSYALQLAVCIVLGPGHIVLYRYLNQSRHKYLATIQLLALNTTILFALPVTIASLTYLKTGPDLFEMAFIYYLNLMQFLAGICLFCNWFTCAYKTNNEIEVRSLVIVFIGGCLHTGLFGGVLSWVHKSSFRDQRFVEFLSICKSHGYRIPDLPRILSNGTQIELSKNRNLNWFFWLCIVEGSIFFIYLLVAMLAKILIKLGLSERFKEFLGRIDKLVASMWTKGLLVCMVSLGCTGGTAWSFAKMHVIRGQLTQNINGSVEDNEWGFGQVVALCLWIPLLLESLGLLIVVFTTVFGITSWTNLLKVKVLAFWKECTYIPRGGRELPVF